MELLDGFWNIYWYLMIFSPGLKKLEFNDVAQEINLAILTGENSRNQALYNCRKLQRERFGYSRKLGKTDWQVVKDSILHNSMIDYDQDYNYDLDQWKEIEIEKLQSLKKNNSYKQILELYNIEPSEKNIKIASNALKSIDSKPRNEKYFDLDKAKEIIKEHNLPIHMIAVWKYRGSIPVKYR
ncbi:hypothetical protein [Chryseobacterium sp. MYb328]|uniref:hypothetical protein n=1 Tax=Chryseobacterium sp. MYb328 TaxID=2745231 RepID=UPI003099C437